MIDLSPFLTPSLGWQTKSLCAILVSACYGCARLAKRINAELRDDVGFPGRDVRAPGLCILHQMRATEHNIYADDLVGRVRLKFDHAHSHRDWEIVGETETRGFYLLSSRVNIGRVQDHRFYQAFEMVVHESDFERITL
jgi:hypothetical protein